MNHIVRGRLLLNVTVAAVLLGAVFGFSHDAQNAALPLCGAMLVMVFLNTYLGARASTQVMQLRASVQRLTAGDFGEPVPLTGDEPIGSLAEVLERLRKQLYQQNQDVLRQVGAQSKMSGDIDGVLRELRDTIAAQMSALEETSASLHEMTTSAKQIAQSVETLARGAEESSSSILEMAASNDEVAENMVNLASAVQESATSIEEMTYSIREVAKNVEALSATAEETSSSMNEMDISIRQVENNANETARLSEEVSRAAGLGAQAITSTIEGMNKIKGYSEGTVRVIARLGDKIGEIDKILRIIDDVAEQTNLLALNAAIIAAQAGEHGKGFAVVADEIKDLAERSSASTKDISELIKSVQTESRNAIDAVERGAKSVDDGVKVSHQAEEALRKILESAERATQMVCDIARATVEQARGSKQVTDAIGSIAETVQQIATATSEQARGSEQILRAAERMKNITKHVERSSQEQTRGGKQITRSIESISEMVSHLHQAQREQTKGGDQILQSIESLREIVRQQETRLGDLGRLLEALGRTAEFMRSMARGGNNTTIKSVSSDSADADDSDS